MNEDQRLIQSTVNRIFTDLCDKTVVDLAEEGNFPRPLWQTLEENGLTMAGIPEATGGSGGEPEDGLIVIKEAGRFAAPLPLAETWMAAQLLADCGQSTPAGPITVAMGDFVMANGRVTGEANDVPFVGWAEHLLLVNKSMQVSLLKPQQVDIERGVNLAGEPMGRVTAKLAADCWQSSRDSNWLHRRGAASRVALMCGALESVLEMSVQYATDRKQFGRAISKFQAVQHLLARLAGEVAVASRASDLVLKADPDTFDIGIAKARVGEAAGIVSEIAHQVHGAIGYTLEHALNHRTRRLWQWRDEYGNENVWNRRVGQWVIDQGSEGVWPFIAGR